jgi:hypothetical protein
LVWFSKNKNTSQKIKSICTHFSKLIFSLRFLYRYLQDKKVGIDLVAPYSFIPTYKGLQDINKIEGIENKTGEVEKNERLPAWMRLLMDARTFFEHSHD